MVGHMSLMTYLPARRVAEECEPHGKPNWSQSALYSLGS